jgi:hypothetical protein
MNLFPNIITNDERLEEFEVNYTPIGVVRQGLQFFKDRHHGFEVRRFLDPSAGQGVYCKVVRELWPNAHITAVEPREEEREGLLEVADAVIVDMFDVLHFEDGFDLIATNPPFKRAKEWVSDICEANLAAFLLLLNTVQAFQRSVGGVNLMREFTPIEEFRVAQGVRCKHGSSGDKVSYSHWLWDVATARIAPKLSSKDAPSWQSYQLPLLSAGERKN